jgi:hypothetical protein
MASQSKAIFLNYWAVWRVEDGDHCNLYTYRAKQNFRIIERHILHPNSPKVYIVYISFC